MWAPKRRESVLDEGFSSTALYEPLLESRKEPAKRIGNHRNQDAKPNAPTSWKLRFCRPGVYVWMPGRVGSGCRSRRCPGHALHFAISEPPALSLGADGEWFSSFRASHIRILQHLPQLRFGRHGNATCKTRVESGKRYLSVNP